MATLGLPPGGDWREPLPELSRGARLPADLERGRTWLGRRLRGRSSGDHVAAERPEPAPVQV